MFVSHPQSRFCLRRLALSSAFAAALLAGHSAQAAVLSWGGGTVNLPAFGNGASEGGAGDWSVSIANWDPGMGLAHVVWPSTGLDNDAAFGGPGNPGIVTLQSPITANDISFQVPGYVLNGTGANALTLNGTTSTFTLAAGITATINAPLTGTVTTVSKAGVGKLTWTGANTYTGPATILAGVLNIQNGSALGTADAGTTISSGAALQFQGGITVAAEPLTIAGGGESAQPNSGALRNISGDNSFNGPITQTGSTRYTSESGLLTLNAISATGNTVINGAGDVRIAGPISGAGGLVRDTLNPLTQSNSGGQGVVTLAGDNSYTGNTTLQGGTLRLDYATNDTSKLSDAGILVLAGGTLQLAGGTHAETVGSTTLNAGATTRITRSSGTSVINLNTITTAPATGLGGLIVVGAGVATTDNANNATGILGFAYRFLNGTNYSWAVNSTNGPDGGIVGFSGYTDVNRLGGTLPGGSIHTRIVDGGTTGNITLGAVTQISSLQASATAGASTVAFTNPTDTLNIGDESSGAIWLTPTSASLTIGASAGSGILTTGATAEGTAASLNLINDSAAGVLTINSAITNNGADVVGLIKSGSGSAVLNGTLSYGGNTIIGGGITALTTGGGTLVISGKNTAPTGNISIGSESILQLQASPANIDVEGGVPIAKVIGTTGAAGSQLGLFNFSTLQLRSDSSVTFAGTNGLASLNGSNNTINVDQLTGAGSNGVLTISPGTSVLANAVTINITGGHGYSLALGTLSGIGTTAAALTLNPISANVSLAGYTSSATLATTLNLSGSLATGTNVVSGVIANSTGTGTLATNIVKLGASTWDLQGANTTTGTILVRQGTLTLSGNRTAGTAGITVADTNTLAATLNIQAGNFSVGGSLTVGSGDSTVTGTVNQTGGIVTLTTTGSQLLVGNGGAAANNGSTGIYNLSGGTLNGAATVVANRGMILGVNVGTTGIFNLSGTGTVAMGTGTLQLGRSDSVVTGSTGIFNQTGAATSALFGTLTIGGNTPAGYFGNKGTLNVQAGSFTANAFTLLGAAESSVSNITIGGTSQVTLPAFPTNARGVNSVVNLTFDGGTLLPLAASAAYFDGLTNATITSNGAKFNVAAGKDITVGQNFNNASGSTGTLTKLGTGTLTLSGTANAFTGASSVLAGGLIVSGSLAGAVSVGDPANQSASATFGGAGTVRGVTAFGSGTPGSSGATIDPGNVIGGGAASGTGILNTGNLSIQSGAHLAIQLGAAAAGLAPSLFDQVSVTGTVSLANADLQISLFNTPAFASEVFTLVRNDGTGDSIGGTFSFVNGIAAALGQGATFTLGGQRFEVSYRAEGGVFDAGAGAGNDFAIRAIPEPGALVSLLSGLSLMLGVRRFRRSAA